MPPVVSPVVQAKIDLVKPAAIERSIIQTQIWAELNKIVVVNDTRSTEVKNFEAEILRNGGMNKATQLIAEKVFGENITPVPPSAYAVSPIFSAAFKVVTPHWVTDQVIGTIPVGSVLLTVSSGKGTYRTADGNLHKLNLLNTYVQPATDAEIATLLDGLFSVRPAATLKLFGAPMDSKVTSILSEEE